MLCSVSLPLYPSLKMAALDRGLHTLGIFLNVSKAYEYDEVDHSILFCKNGWDSGVLLWSGYLYA